MLIPNNEGKVCDAVVRLLEARTGEMRTALRHPELDGIGPPVDLRLRLGAQEYAIEHTRIESFEGQMETGVAFTKISRHIRRVLSGTLPHPAYYELHVPVSVSLPEKAARRTRALDSLVEWIRTSADRMHGRNSGKTGAWRSPMRADDRIRETPPGFACEIEFLRWPDAALMGRESGELVAKLICPEELEELRADRVRRAYSDKCPKLERAKAEGVRTVLALENVDIALASFDLIGNLLPMLLAERRTAPDEIYLAETHTNPWWVWPMKRDGDHWTRVGMSEWNQTRHAPDELPTLNEPFVPPVSEWDPTTFDEGELGDLSMGNGSKRV